MRHLCCRNEIMLDGLGKQNIFLQPSECSRDTKQLLWPVGINFCQSVSSLNSFYLLVLSLDPKESFSYSLTVLAVDKIQVSRFKSV